VKRGAGSKNSGENSKKVEKVKNSLGSCWTNLDHLMNQEVQIQSQY